MGARREAARRQLQQQPHRQARPRSRSRPPPARSGSSRGPGSRRRRRGRATRPTRGRLSSVARSSSPEGDLGARDAGALAGSLPPTPGAVDDDAAQHGVRPAGQRLEALARLGPSPALPSRRPSSTTSVSTPSRARPRRPRLQPSAAALRRAFSTTTSPARPPRAPDVGDDDLELGSQRAAGSPGGAATPRRGSAEVGEPERDLALRRLVGVGAVDEVEGDLEGEVAADRARRRLERVRRADQLAGGGNRLAPSSTIATSGPPVMNATSSPKNGFSVCSA